MEASTAGLAAAAPSGEAAAGEQGDAQESQQQPSIADLSSTLDGIGQMLEQQRDYLQSEPWKPAETQEEGQEEAEPDEADFGFLDETQPGFTPEGAAQQLQAMIENLADKRAEQRIAPLQETVQDMQIKAASDALIGRYPQMGDEAVAETVIDTAQKWAESIGKPELGATPELWELVYLAGRTAEQANREDSQQSDAATLEGAGGASPGGAAQGDLPTTESVTASWRSSSLPLFRGGR